MPAISFVSGAQWGDLTALAELYTETFQEYFSDGKHIPVSASPCRVTVILLTSPLPPY